VGVEDGRWHHVAFTYAHSNRAVRLYVDNVQRANGTSFSNLVYEASELRIGQGAGGRPLTGGSTRSASPTMFWCRTSS
jgi:hypothetical protein